MGIVRWFIVLACVIAGANWVREFVNGDGMSVAVSFLALYCLVRLWE